MKLKETLVDRFRALAVACAEALLRHPVESGIALFGCGVCMLGFGCGWPDRNIPALAYLFFFAALVLNRLTEHLRGAWRFVYLFSWLPAVPLVLWSGLDAWIGSSRFVVTLVLLVPLALILATRQRDDRLLAAEALRLLRAAVSALLLANLALALFVVLLFSVTELFGLWEETWQSGVTYAYIFVETLCVPLLFLTLLDRRRPEPGVRLLAAAIDGLLTPALLLYLALLWLYILKILFAWELPEGGVAYMVFGFVLCGLVVRVLRTLVGGRRGERFYRCFGALSLPAALLFWTGVARRIGDYGMTEARVWLVVAGLAMTLCLGLLLDHRTGRAFWLATAVFLPFAAVAWIPALAPQRISLRSQTLRAERLARELGRLADDGTLLRTPVAREDTMRRADYRRLYGALVYLESHGAVDRFGPDASGTLCETLSGTPLADRTDEEPRRTVEAPAERSVATKGWNRLYTGFVRIPGAVRSYAFEEDTLRIRLDGREVLCLTADELLERQIARAGHPFGGAAERSDPEAAERLLDCPCDSVRILFGSMSFRGAGDRLRLEEVTVDMVLTR